MYNHEPSTDLAKHLVKRIEDLGRIRELLKGVLRNEIFDELSKHDEWWHSAHLEEGEKLDELRRTFIGLQDELWTIQEILIED